MSSLSTEGLCVKKELGGGTSCLCLIFATWKQNGNFWCRSQSPLPLDCRGILKKKGKCTDERNVKDFIHQMAISRKLGLDWQLSLPHNAHFLLGKGRPTMTRLTWCLCPAELLFSAFESNPRNVLLWFAPNSAFLPRVCVVPGLIPGKLLLWPLSSYSYKNLRAIGLFLPTLF